MFGVLRFIRALFGFAAALYALRILVSVGARGQIMLETLIVELVFIGLCSGVFFGMRKLINKMHIKRFNTPHPALINKWGL